MKRRSANLFTAAVMFLLLLLSLQPARASTWNSVTVDNSTNVTGKYLSMAADPAGKLHIGYLDTNTAFPILKYATNTGGSWVTESLEAYVPNIVNASTSTVYTPGGPRIMAYSNNLQTGQYKYQAVRKIAGDGWQLQDIAGGKFPNGMDQYPINSVSATTQTGAVQHQGFTFITYSDGNTLWYANERDMYYYPFQGAGSGNQSDLAVDSNGNVNIVYYNPTTTYTGDPPVVQYQQGLMFALNNTTPVSLVSGVISNPTIAIDANNTLHVCYVDAAFNIMHMNKPAGGSWSTPTSIGSAGSLGGYLSLRPDNAGGLHLAFYRNTGASGGTKGELYYKYRSPTTGIWTADEQIPPLGQSNNYGQYASVVVDRNNNVSIAFYDEKRTKLCLTTKVTPAIDASPAPLYYGNVQQGSSLTKTVTVTNKGNANLAISGSATLSGADASEFLISSNSCTSGLVIAPGSAGCAITVQLFPTSPGAKTAALNIGSTDPVIPGRSVELRGTSYTPPDSFTINASAGVGGTISPSGDVTVAGGGNQTFTMTPGPGYLVGSVLVDNNPVGALTSYDFIEVGAGHTISVSFVPVTPVTMWSITEVDNTGTTTGKYCSIANDPASKLHIGYLDNSTTPPTLKYATNRSGSWGTEPVSLIANVANAGTATVFSENVGPRVMAYSYDSTSGLRKYQAARKWTDAPPPNNDGHWQLQDIAGGFFDPPANTMPQPPIYSTTTDTFTGATQFGGFTFITYTDGNNLWYANERDYFYLKLDQDHSVTGAGKQSDLVLDASGNIHLVYYTPGSLGTGELRYGTGQGSSSQGYSESILVTGITSDPSITLDGNGTLHVAYIQGGRVKYLNGAMVSGSRVWAAPYDLGPCGTAGAYSSIKANGLNIVHLSYYSNNGASTGILMYAQRTADGTWSIPTPVWASGEAVNSDYGWYAALVVDDHHNVNIAYHDASRTSLKVAKKLMPVISASPAQIDYGTVTPGSQSSQTVTVTNPGQANLKIGTVTLDGTDSSQFSVTANTCDGVTIAPGGAGCSITVNFAPIADGAKAATLHIPSNDSYTSDKQIPLQGTAAGGSHMIQAAAGSGGTITPSGDVIVADGADQTFTVTPSTGFTSQVTSDCPGFTDNQNGTYTCPNVQADYFIQALFVSNVKVGSVFFGTLQNAYNASGEGAPVQARAVTFGENLVCDMNKDIVFAGGYDPAFAVQNGNSILTGELGVSAGGIEVQNVGLE